MGGVSEPINIFMLHVFNTIRGPLWGGVLGRPTHIRYMWKLETKLYNYYNSFSW
jgi:hypothetical protein